LRPLEWRLVVGREQKMWGPMPFESGRELTRTGLRKGESKETPEGATLMSMEGKGGSGWCRGFTFSQRRSRGEKRREPSPSKSQLWLLTGRTGPSRRKSGSSKTKQMNKKALSEGANTQTRLVTHLWR
jgi:hypothetical protein